LLNPTKAGIIKVCAFGLQSIYLNLKFILKFPMQFFKLNWKAHWVALEAIIHRLIQNMEENDDLIRGKYKRI